MEEAPACEELFNEFIQEKQPEQFKNIDKIIENL